MNKHLNTFLHNHLAGKIAPSSLADRFEIMILISFSSVFFLLYTSKQHHPQ